jgi:hypothetical protein
MSRRHRRLDKGAAWLGVPRDIQVKLDKLRADAAECALISSLATDSQKRVFFEKVGGHLTDLVSEIEASFRRPTVVSGGPE